MISARTTNIILGLALCASLSFNLAFLAAKGRVSNNQTVAGPTSNGQLFSALTNTINLTPEQKNICQELTSTWSAERRVLSDSIGLLREEVRALMNKAPVDLVALRERTDRISELHHERRKAGMARMEEFLTLLTPEQAAAVRELRAGQLTPPPHPEGNFGQDPLTKFDVDQDGTLDEKERKAALLEIQNRGQVRDLQMKKLREQFDANGNGELEAEERRALREHLHQNRPPEGRPGPRGPRGPRGRNSERSPNRSPNG